ncbi:MAG: hypothetical protein HYZ74_01370 [Elusimicrobia bacterium]|nr:hypothetical protein [Elusimicrobiota bacterium]
MASSDRSFSEVGITWGALMIAAFAAIVLFLFALSKGSLVMRVYTPAAVVVGFLLFRHDSDRYLRFVWGLWFLTPLVRRLADFQTNWNPVSMIMLAPMLVTLLSAGTVCLSLHRLFTRRFLPFTLMLVSLLYALVVGGLTVGWTPAIYDFLTWSSPIVFCIYLQIREADAAALGKIVGDAFIWGLFIMGSYGIAQFCLAPEWDTYWLLKSQMFTSAGSPEPFGLRVWSTMNSPGVFAHFMMAGLLINTCRIGFASLGASAIGYVCFGLTLVRSAWLGWASGMAYLAWYSIGRMRISFFITIAAFATVAVPLIMSGKIDALNERLASMTEIEEDTSYLARMEFYSSFFSIALTNIKGEGMGSTGLATKLTTEKNVMGEMGNFDSGLMQIPYVLGYIGGFPYLTGLLLFLTRVFSGSGGGDDLFITTCRGIVLGMLLQLIFTLPLIGASGMIIWSFAGFVLSARENAGKAYG